jgi:hypothetical protein
MSRAHRVLVTGSRNWGDHVIVYEKLALEAKRARDSGLAMVVVHGACPSGADKMADDWVREWSGYNWPITSEPHPAAWSTLGASAGPTRNRYMVSRGADVVLAFILDESRGASGCLKEARKAGLLVDVTTRVSGALTAS